MRKKIIILWVIFCSIATIFIWGCAITDGGDAVRNEETITAVIKGGTESPDPILKKVQELEIDGILKKVIVMESDPVQITVTGPKNVVEMLKTMP